MPFPPHIPCCSELYWDCGDPSFIPLSAAMPLCGLAQSLLTLYTMIQGNVPSSSYKTNPQSQPEANQHQPSLGRPNAAKHLQTPERVAQHTLHFSCSACPGDPPHPLFHFFLGCQRSFKMAISASAELISTPRYSELFALLHCSSKEGRVAA